MTHTQKHTRTTFDTMPGFMWAGSFLKCLSKLFLPGQFESVWISKLESEGTKQACCECAVRAKSVWERKRRHSPHLYARIQPPTPLIHTPTLHTCAHIQTQSTFYPFPTPKSHTTSSLSHILKSQRSAGREGEEGGKSKRERGQVKEKLLC